MDYNIILPYIKQRMQEMDYEEFTWQPVRVKNAANIVYIHAQNEFYYLVAKTVPATLQIQSDANIFAEATDYNNFNFYGIQEFTGEIVVAAGVPIDLEFIRVLPRIKKSDDVKGIRDLLIAEAWAKSKKK